MATTKRRVGGGLLALAVALLILCLIQPGSSYSNPSWIDHMCLNETHLIKLGPRASVLIRPQIVGTELRFMVDLHGAVYGAFTNGTHTKVRERSSLQATELDLLENERRKLEDIDLDPSQLGPQDRFFSVRYMLEENLTKVRQAVNCQVEMLKVEGLDVLRVNEDEFTVQGTIYGIKSFQRRSFSLARVAFTLSGEKLHGLTLESSLVPVQAGYMSEFRSKINEASRVARVQRDRKRLLGSFEALAWNARRLLGRLAMAMSTGDYNA